MSQKLKAIDFDYTKEDRFNFFFRNYVKDLLKNIKNILSFRDELRRKCNGIPFNQLQEEWDYGQVLLAGMDEDGEFKKNSLAKVYKELFGLHLSNPVELIEKISQGLTPDTEALVEETEFIGFLEQLQEKTEAVLEKAVEEGFTREEGVEPEYDFYDTLADQEILTKYLKDLIRSIGNVMPNYSERALFLWTLDKSTHKYLTIAYPKLKDEEDAWENLQERFGLSDTFVPEIDEDSETAQTRREQYTVYAYEENSLGERVLDLQKFIFKVFPKVKTDLEMVFGEVPDITSEFEKEADKKLDRIGWGMPIKTKGKDNKYKKTRGDTTEQKYFISGVIIPEKKYAGYSTKYPNGNYNIRKKEVDLSLFKVLDDLSPGIFLLNGLRYELDINQEYLEVEKPQGRR